MEVGYSDFVLADEHFASGQLEVDFERLKDLLVVFEVLFSY
jgi:hypothetical protein